MAPDLLSPEEAAKVRAEWERPYEGVGWDAFDFLLAGLVLTDIAGWVTVLFLVTDDVAAITFLIILALIGGLSIAFWRMARGR